MSHRTRAIRFVRHWHARVGVLAALFFLFLAGTGLALNHTDVLRLSQKQIASSWLMHWYGLHAQVPSQGYLFPKGYFASDREHWVMDGHVLAAVPQAVRGAVEAGGVRYLATADTLYLYQPDGSLVDKLTGSALPGASITRIGVLAGALAMETPQGIYTSEDALDWKPAAAEGVAWSAAQALPSDIQQQLTPFFSPNLPLERVLLDVHSGRILGRHGPLLMDLVAVVLSVLAISGVWIYLRSLRKRH